MKYGSPIAIFFAILTLLFARNTKAASAFDGNWLVTLDAKAFKNPDGRNGLAYVRRFPATVKSGVFHGEIGKRGKPEWLELNGQIGPDGKAELTATLITGDQKYNFTVSENTAPGKGKSYSYLVDAHFNSRSGTGKSTDWRTRIFTFVKN
jgi:hypothetical protein